MTAGLFRGESFPGLLQVKQRHFHARLAEVYKDMFEVQATMLPTAKVQPGEDSAIRLQDFLVTSRPQ